MLTAQGSYVNRSGRASVDRKKLCRYVRVMPCSVFRFVASQCGVLSGLRQCNQSKEVISKKASLALCPKSDTNHHEFNVVLKDNDINFKLHLSPPDASRLASTLSADVRFLESQGIMDYSLLVGVHRHANRPPTQEELLKVGWSFHAVS